MPFGTQWRFRAGRGLRAYRLAALYASIMRHAGTLLCAVLSLFGRHRARQKNGGVWGDRRCGERGNTRACFFARRGCAVYPATHCDAQACVFAARTCRQVVHGTMRWRFFARRRCAVQVVHGAMRWRVSARRGRAVKLCMVQCAGMFLRTA